MFEFCADPSALDGLTWFACYLTTGKHLLFYQAFLLVIGLMLVTAPVARGVGFLGALARRSQVAPLRWIGTFSEVEPETEAQPIRSQSVKGAVPRGEGPEDPLAKGGSPLLRAILIVIGAALLGVLFYVLFG